jgi:glycosyltransferase involved in cell wall biosynthesis
MKTVLFFFPHKPHPPQFGAHKRCLQLLNGLMNLGCRVTFTSSAYGNRGWTEAAVKDFRERFGCSVDIFRPTVRQRGISAGFDYTRRLARGGEGISQRLTESYGREWFSQVALESEPDLLFMNYANYDALVDWNIFSPRISIIEIHDLITVNKQMRLALKREVGNRALRTGKGLDAVLDLDFFKNRQMETEQAEYEIYDRYLYTLCISQQERDSVTAHTSHTLAVHLPMTYEVDRMRNSHDAEALFCIGPNPFNSQGYYFFIYKILPLIREQSPDFRMKVTGNFHDYCIPTLADGVVYTGFVEELKSTYESARFFVCPVFGGTGQQVKIVEAMAHGLPVVAFTTSASRSPMRHGINGLIADSVEEFADHVLSLWNNKALCRKMGEAARETIETECSQERLMEGLTPLVEARRG